MRVELITEPRLIADQMACESISLWDRGKLLDSSIRSFSARFFYLIDLAIQGVTLCYALGGSVYGALYGCVTGNWKNRHLSYSWSLLTNSSNRFFLSAFGTLVSPSITYRYRDAQILYIVVAVRIVLFSAFLFYRYVS